MIDSKKYKLYESAMIKEIRRGLVDKAIYWGIILYKFGHEELIWRRLKIHLSEDIGIAERQLPATIHALYENWKELKNGDRASYESETSVLMPIVHAIMLMATSKKTRAVDNAITYHIHNNEEYEVPDYAIDYHSPFGRRLGRNINHFLNEAAYISNEDESIDLWKDKVKQIYE